MSFKLAAPKERQLIAGKHERAKLDLAVSESRIGWKKMTELAYEMTGKREGFTITETKRIIERIRKEIKN